MRMGHLVQADIDLPGRQARFWMDSCGGRDPVAMAVLHGGWAAYQAPLPALVADWCSRLAPLVVDLGAGTGFHSLLAIACGAARAVAFEPSPTAMEVFRGNVAASEMGDRIDLRADARNVSLPADGAAVLRLGGMPAGAAVDALRDWAGQVRPAIVCEAAAEAMLARLLPVGAYRRWTPTAAVRPSAQILLPADADQRWRSPAIRQDTGA